MEEVLDEESVDNTAGDDTMTAFSNDYTRYTRDTRTLGDSVSSESDSESSTRDSPTATYASDASDTLDSKISSNISLSAKVRRFSDKMSHLYFQTSFLISLLFVINRSVANGMIGTEKIMITPFLEQDRCLGVITHKQ